MCFYAGTPEERKVLIAKRDIVCYKILNKGYSLFHEYLYKYNKKNPEIKLIPEKIAYSYAKRISEGYHSYRRQQYAKEGVGYWEQLVQFIIPKGSTYYKNEDEYVSSQIIRKKVIKRTRKRGNY